MPNKKILVVLGLQWGDEGKGKFIDFLVLLLSKLYKLTVARFQGGSNAGHSIEFDDKHIVFHSLPSGMLEKNTENIIGAGVNIDVVSIKKEIENIKGIAPWWRDNLYIAKEATVVVPTAILIDQAEESSRGNKKIGTTGKAIGPTYSDFYGRTNDLSVYEVLDEKVFLAHYSEIKQSHMLTLKSKYNFSFDEKLFENNEQEFFDGIKFLRTLKIISSYEYFENSMKNQRQIIAEGAQGTLLDVRFGTRRDVTSSHTTSAGVCVGLGVAPKHIGEVLGIFKAYTTRVGSGPFPTEIGGQEAYEWSKTHNKKDEEGLNYNINENNGLQKNIALRILGKEYGATTGRLRRCGWLDLPLLKYSINLNGATCLGITKLDILDSLNEIPVCIDYENQSFVDITKLTDSKPIYKVFQGWNTSTRGCTSYKDLPENAKLYIDFIEKETGLPITYISTGPKRDEIIKRQDIL